MRKATPLYLLLAAAIFTSGCVLPSTTPVGKALGASVPTDSVEVLYQEPQRPYEVIALVSCEGGAFVKVPRVVEECRKAAAKVGAEALFVTSILGKGKPTATGKAIRWKK